MNLKTLIALLMLPLSAFGFTNKIDNLWVPGNFRYSTGAAAGSIFTSDASGNASWSVAGASGDVFLNGMTTTKMNNYTAGTSNFFRGPVMLGNDNISPLIFISAGTAATNIVERHRMYIDTASGNVWKLDSTAGTSMTEDFGRITINQLFRTLDGVQIGDAAGDPLTINSAAATVPNGLNVQSGLLMISTATGRVGINTTTPNGVLHIVGDAASPFITLGNSGTGGTNWYIWSTQNSSVSGPGKLLFGTTLSTSGSKVAFTSEGWVGINNTFPSNRFSVNVPVTSVSSATALIASGASNQVPLVIIGAVGQSSNYFQIVNSAGADIANISLSGRASVSALTASSTVSGNSFGGSSINGQMLRVISGTTSTTNLVVLGFAGQTTPYAIFQDSSGVSYFQIGSIGTTTIGTNALSALPFREILTGVATLNFASGIAGAQEDLPITVSGTTTNDVASIGVPFTAAANGGAFTPYTSNNTVYVRFSNATAGVVDPASAQFRATVIKY